MNNREVAEILERIGDLLQIKGEVVYKSLAYRRAADNIRNLDQDINKLHREGKLEDIPGVGEALAQKIGELLATGRLRYLEELEEEIPASLADLLTIPDVGPKTAKLLWEQLGISSVAEVEKAARAGRLRRLPGLGEKTEAKILAGIEMLYRRSARLPLGIAWPVAQSLLQGLRQDPSVLYADIGGSLRRMRSTVGDIDLLAAPRATEEREKVIDAFVALPQVEKVELRGPTKCTVRLYNGLQVDLRVLPGDRYGSLLQHFTGSKEHNVELREFALKKGLSLSEYGFKQDGKEILCPHEEDVYRTLGLDWIPPEIREARGEIQAALEHRLPRLLQTGDIRGDLHVHSNWSDGAATLEQMAEAARDRGYQYVVVSDHSHSLGIAKGLSVDRLREQREVIDALNARYSDFRILQGAEVEIRIDGSLDFPDEVMAELDVVVASMHTGLRRDREQVTSRLVGVMRNPHVDVIGHPIGRLLNQREGADLDMDAVLKTAAETGTILEVNSNPLRLDLDDIHIRRAVEQGVRLAINSDAHNPEDLSHLEYGVATARRGWAEAKHVINTLSLDEVLKALGR